MGTLKQVALSGYQEAFLRAVAGGGNVALMAGPGTGKTFTSCLVEGALYVAFSKGDQQELEGRIAPGGQAMTAHALGFKILRDTIGRPIKVVSWDSRIAQEASREASSCAEKLISWHKNTLIPLAECVPCIAWPKDVSEGFITEVVGLAHDAVSALLADFTRGRGQFTMSFDDMPYLALRILRRMNATGKTLPWAHELILVDEFQDQSPCQVSLLEELHKGNPGSQMIVVGDIAQAIYGFRGATGENARLFVERIGAQVLPLLLSYRLPKSAVALLQPFWPGLEVPESNPEGSISELPYAKLEENAGPGSFVVSRTNAPLVSLALRFLVSGRKAMVVGKDIGLTLINLLRKIEGKRPFASPDQLVERVEDWSSRECAKVSGKHKGNEEALQKALTDIQDKARVFSALAENVEVAQDVYALIDRLFEDCDPKNADFIRLSTVHKCKGREAKDVYVLTSTFRKGLDYVPGEEEENCVRGVVLSRHKENLFLVAGLPREED